MGLLNIVTNKVDFFAEKLTSLFVNRNEANNPIQNTSLSTINSLNKFGKFETKGAFSENSIKLNQSKISSTFNNVKTGFKVAIYAIGLILLGTAMIYGSNAFAKVPDPQNTEEKPKVKMNPKAEAKEFAKGFCIFTSKSSNDISLYELAVKNHESYANRHDYTYIKLEDKSSDPWSKFNGFLKIFDNKLETGESQCKYVIGLRDDKIITNRKLKLEDLIERTSKEKDVFFSQDPLIDKVPQISSNVVIAKNSPDAYSLFSKALKMKDQWVPGLKRGKGYKYSACPSKKCEDLALIDLLKKDDKLFSKSGRIPLKYNGFNINTVFREEYSPDGTKVERFGDKPDKTWKNGDFIGSCEGLPTSGYKINVNGVLDQKINPKEVCMQKLLKAFSIS